MEITGLSVDFGDFGDDGVGDSDDDDFVGLGGDKVSGSIKGVN